MRVLVISLCLLASGAQAGLFRWPDSKESRGGGLLGGLVQGIVGFGGKILGENSSGGGSNEKPSRYEASQEGYGSTSPGGAGQAGARYDRVSEPPRGSDEEGSSDNDNNNDREDRATEQMGPKLQQAKISNQDESNLAKTNAAKVLENSNSGNYNKTKSRKAKVTSSQSIRILTPGSKSGGSDSGSYSRNTAAVGQSSSKHKSEASSASLGVQRDGRLDTASVGREREVGVDAAQKAQVTSDSSGFSEILLTQKSVAQKKTKETEARSSGDAIGTGVAVHAAASSSRATSSGRGQFSDQAHESYTRM